MTSSSAPTLPAGRTRLIALHGTIIVLCVVLGGALSFTRGQDINFDQLNYHYYSAYAYETHRLAQDVAPGQVMHSFFSPIVYLPFYFMVRNLSPHLVGVGLGALHGLNLWLAFIIAWIVARRLPAPARTIAIIAAVAISAASPMAISEFGTSMADLLVSLPILAGLALLMSADFTQHSAARTTVTIGLSGALVGAAVSLKLTSAAFAIGLAVAAPFGWSTWRHRLVAILATGIGGAVGFAAIGGSWYLLMWQMFRNPVFPYFNTVFRSTDYPSQTALFDARFVPDGIAQALRLPFIWLKTQTATSEIPFRDARFALLIVLGLGVLAVRPALRRRSYAVVCPAGARLIAFVVVAFCVWMYEWSIQRYIVGLELLMGPAFITLLLWTGVFDVIRGRALAITAAVLAVVFLATVKAPDWGHLGWRKTWYAVDVPATSGAPILFLDAEPLSYVVAALPPQSAAVEVIAWENIPSWGDTIFLRRIHTLLADQPERPVWAVVSGDALSDRFRIAITQYGLKPAGACQTTKGRPFPLTWCPLMRIPAPA